jgi:stalled ribosome alternative rescue factor ArfA
VLSIAGILQVLHKTDVEEKFGKGDYCRKAQNHPEECFSEGRKFSFRAGNSTPGPDPPLHKIFGGQKFLEFPRISTNFHEFP